MAVPDAPTPKRAASAENLRKERRFMVGDMVGRRKGSREEGCGIRGLRCHRLPYGCSRLAAISGPFAEMQFLAGPDLMAREIFRLMAKLH
jgi:hypothetical protein